MNEHNGVSPNDLGHRFLALIQHVDSFNELSAEVVHASVGVPFQVDEVDKSGFYTVKLPSGDWQYSLIYNFDKKFAEYSNVSLELIRSNNAVDASNLPCALKLDEYQTALKKMGFISQPTSYNEIGSVVAFNYTRKNLRVQIIPQQSSSSSDNPGTSCVTVISAHTFEG